MAEPKRIAIIGAGRSGLVAIKSCMEEGMDVVCFEKTDSFGGIWKYREDSIEGVGSVMKSTVNIFSKEMDAFSDFPPPDDMPVYMHHSMMMEYLDMYAEEFGLLEHIRYNHEVIQLVPSSDNNDSGRWLVKYLLLEGTRGKIIEEVFDGVMVCTGKRGYPKQPYFPNQDKFKGKIIHSKHVRTVSNFDKKNVLIVGFGNSAVDAAVDISAVAKQVYLSTRTGGWVFPKIGLNGMPCDMLLLRRRNLLLRHLSPKKFNAHIQDSLCMKFDHEIYNIKPDHDILTKQPTVSDEFPDKVITGRLILKDNVREFGEDDVLFEGDHEHTKVDIAIFATGYEVKIPFLEESFFRDESKELSLYKSIFPTFLERPTLAFIGLVQPIGPSAPIAESQCRWAALVFNEKLKLPSPEVMSAEVCCNKLQRSERHAKAPGSIPVVDYIKYMDELANQYNAKPDISRLFMKDPMLYWTCFTGPCLPYQYRLQGRHCWSKSREAVLKCQERMLAPFKERKFGCIETPKKTFSVSKCMLAVVMALTLCLVVSV